MSIQVCRPRRSAMPAEHNLPDRELTPEKVFWTRRKILAALGLGVTALAGYGWWVSADESDDEVLARGRVELPGEDDLFPAAPNERFRELDRPLTGRAAAAR